MRAVVFGSRFHFCGGDKKRCLSFFGNVLGLIFFSVKICRICQVLLLFSVFWVGLCFAGLEGFKFSLFESAPVDLGRCSG